MESCPVYNTPSVGEAELGGGMANTCVSWPHLGEHLLHALQVASHRLLATNLQHAVEMVDLLRWCQVDDALNADGGVRPVDIPLVVVPDLLPAKLALYDAYCTNEEGLC